MTFHLKRGFWFVFRQIDVPAVCAGKVMKAALKHIEIIAKAREKGMFLYQLTHRVYVSKSGQV